MFMMIVFFYYFPKIRPYILELRVFGILNSQTIESVKKKLNICKILKYLLEFVKKNILVRG
jgi:hypothetical protein